MTGDNDNSDANVRQRGLPSLWRRKHPNGPAKESGVALDMGTSNANSSIENRSKVNCWN